MGVGDVAEHMEQLPHLDQPPRRLLPGKAIISPGGARLPNHMSPRNPLLVRDEVGRAKASCYDLPPSNVSFGHKGAPDPEGAREVTMQWVSHTPRQRRDDARAVPDFLVFNKRAIHSSRQYAARSERNVEEVPVYTPRTLATHCRVQPKALPSEVTPGWTYGKKVRPSTPIDQVMKYKWAEEGEQELQQFYAGMIVLQSDQRNVRKIPLTKASRGHAALVRKAAEPIEQKQPFKMKKFQRVPAKLNTHRPDPRLGAVPAEEAVGSAALNTPPPSVQDV